MKKYAPPRYTEPRISGVRGGVIGHANNLPVSLGHAYKTTKATSRKGMITTERPRVIGRTRSFPSIEFAARRAIAFLRCHNEAIATEHCPPTGEPARVPLTIGAEDKVGWA
jgi:hypothetical protein